MKQHILIIGAGHSGITLAASLRDKNWEGPITLVGDENTLPYQRPPLSKKVLQVIPFTEPALLRPEKFYQDNEINLIQNHRVTSLDPENHTVQYNQQTIRYDSLILATGSLPIKPPIKGLSNVKCYQLRTTYDAKCLHEIISPSKHILILGGGFIGLEVAASLRQQGIEVSLIEREPHILNRVAVPIVADFLKKLHLDRGVQIHCNTSIDFISRTRNQIHLHSTTGQIFKGHELILGAGSIPNIELAEQAGLKVNNGIKVDEHNQTSYSDIYAIGDCCNQFNQRYGIDLRLESIQNALDQAKNLAAHLCGENAPHQAVPWFWSDQYETKLQIAGINKQADTQIIRSDSSDANGFSVWHFKKGKLEAMDAINRPTEFNIGKKLIKSQRKIPLSSIVDSTVDLKSFL